MVGGSPPREMALSTPLTPRQIVAELDKYIVGQDLAKRAVAVAIRNRWRRLQLGAELRADVPPKNILMVGPTGVGKTEIARRLAQLVGAPFIKVEATKYTEVGYHGRDVESIVRDLVERAVVMVREELAESHREEARLAAEDRVIDQLLPGADAGDAEQAARRERTREKLRAQIRAGGLSERLVEATVEEKSVPPHVMEGMGLTQLGPEFEQFFERVMPSRTRRRRLPVPAAIEYLAQQEIDRVLDKDRLHQEAVQRCEEAGVVFLDEIDKICGRALAEGGPDVSRSGVQRDLLPIVEGSTVSTRYGPVRTNHILFIAAGAFTNVSPSDLMPELQGRFPIRVELSPLTADDFVRILTEPRNALIRQQVELMKTEGVALTFTEDAVVELARQACRANELLEDIGARRLYTVVEKVMEDIAFYASEAENKQVTIDADDVRIRLASILDSEERRGFEL